MTRTNRTSTDEMSLPRGVYGNPEHPERETGTHPFSGKNTTGTSVILPILLSGTIHLAAACIAVMIGFGISASPRTVEVKIVEDRLFSAAPPSVPSRLAPPLSAREKSPAKQTQTSENPSQKNESVTEITPVTAVPETAAASTKSDIPGLRTGDRNPDISASASSRHTGVQSLQDVGFGTDQGPYFVHREMPVYPASARKLGKEGSVLLRLTISEEGKLTDVEVLKAEGYGLTEAAVEAVRRSTFGPARKEGKNVPSRAVLPVTFRLKTG